MENVFRALLYLGCLALMFFLCVWFLGEIGLALPTMVFRILVAMFVVIAVWVLYRLFAGSFGNFTIFPGPKPPG